jgi:nucleotide-binding universal stress UspA family protein
MLNHVLVPLDGSEFAA